MNVLRGRPHVRVVLALVAATAAARAASYPAPVGDTVNDFARVLKPDDVRRIEAHAQEARGRLGIPIVVATIPSLAQQNAGAWSIERYAAGLYNDWGIGSAEIGNKGVLLLVSVGDRKLRIATGAGLGASFDGPAREIIDRTIVPRFKRGDMSTGVREGVEAIARALGAGAATAEAEAPAEGPTTAGPASPRQVVPPAGVQAPAAAPAPSRQMDPPVEAETPRRAPASGPPPPTRIPTGGEGIHWQPHGTGIGPSGSSWGVGSIIAVIFVVLVISAIISVFRRAGTSSGLSAAPSGSGWGGWGGLIGGAAAGILGSMLHNAVSGRRRHSSFGSGLFDSSGSSWAGGSSSHGGPSSGHGFSSGGGSSSSGGSFGGGFTSGGGASGSW